MSATVDQMCRHKVLRTLQIRLQDDNANKAIPKVAAARNDDGREKKDHVLGDLSHHCHYVCHLVFICPYRPDDRGNKNEQSRVALLDKAHSRGNRIYWRFGLHVRTVQNERPAVPTVAGI